MRKKQKVDQNGQHGRVFSLYCEWSLCATLSITAKTLEEAIQKACDAPNLPTGSYIEDSFHVNLEMAKDMNQ